jgi:hypothetical protein
VRVGVGVASEVQRGTEGLEAVPFPLPLSVPVALADDQAEYEVRIEVDGEDLKVETGPV